MRRLLTTTALALTAAALSAPAAHAADPCPNAQYRGGAGANLPDCRAWEQVTPADKNGFETPHSQGFSFSPDGGTALTTSQGNVSGAGGISQLNVFASNRGSGWTTAGVDPPFSTVSETPIFSRRTLGFSDDRSKALVVTTRKLTPDAVEGSSNLYARDTKTGSYALVTTVPGSALAADLGGISRVISASFYGASEDFKYVVFPSTTPLVAGAAPNSLYLAAEGRITLVSRLDDGTPVSVPSNDYAGSGERLVSNDGRRITFRANDSNFRPALYQRVDGTSTVLISRSFRDGEDPTTPVPLANGFYRGRASSAWASSDGRTAIFATDGVTNLTNGAPSAFYQWSADGGPGGTLTGLFDGISTPWSPDAFGFQLFDISPDGRYVWFSLINPDDASEVYVLDRQERRVTFKGASTGDETLAFDLSFSTNGARLMLMSRRALTGYDQAGCSGPCVEAFLYDATDSSPGPVCISCGPPGTRSVGNAGIDSFTPGRPRGSFIADDGKAMFSTPQRIVGTDANALSDVYVYTPGRGSALVSSGTGQFPANAGGLTPSGNDAFFYTADPLVPQDEDRGATDVYDARVGGGLAAQQIAPSQAGGSCASANCPGPQPTVPAPEAPGTQSFQTARRAPAFRVSKVTASARRAAASSGRLKVSAEVGEAGRLTARATATVQGRKAVVGRVARTVSKRGRYVLELSLSRSARLALARARKLKVSLSVSYSRAAAASSQSVTLSAPRAGSSKRGGAR